ncbi:tetratricopeptide repeat protein [Actinosynnema sp. NPDC059335]|uniref:tetratricopeptide repeat protein n=1 Tax=Actinosynnema sp. NPDC059335 TaxID=3346804 RepID=UPI0036730726
MDRTPSPGELLDPRRAVVPFHGRVEELAALTRWRDGDGVLSVLLLHGPAGVGKTRLAVHFAAGSTVRVVDDADLIPWHDLRYLISAATDRTRILLVARDAGWWWSAVRQRAADFGCPCAELAVEARPDEHGPSFAAACAHFADVLGLPCPTVMPPDVPTLHDLHLAALAAVHGASADDPVGLVRRLIAVDPNPPTRGRLAEDVLAVTLLDERITPSRTPEALETLLRAADRWPHVRRRAEELFTAEPDLARTATCATLRALVESPTAAAAVARHVFDDPRFHGDPLPALLTRTLLDHRAATAGKPELAELHGVLAARAALAGLHEEALAAARQEVARYRELAEEDPVEHRPALVDAVADLALRHVAVGRPEDALATSEEAVALCRVAAAEDEDCVPHLAGALDRLGQRYAAVGRRDEALTAVGEAAARYRDLAAAHPALFRVDLAKVTHHHAVRLFDAGRPDEAARVTRLALARWREVAEADPRYEAEFARTLAALADLLSGQGRRDEAVPVVEESIGVLRRLARANPRDFEPELAGALGGLSALLGALERDADAVRAAEEAVLVRRRIARDGDPHAVGHLAVALGDQVEVLRGPERLTAAEEAVELLRPLAVRHPVDHQVPYAVARSRLARLLLAAGREDEARRLVDEVLAVAPRLPHRPPVAHAATLASALRDLADSLAAHDHGHLALRAAEQVVGIRRDLLGRSRSAPVAYAVALHRTAVLLHDRSDPEASGRARLAVLVWHLTHTADELAAEPRYADTLSLYARVCAESGRHVERALSLAHRAMVVLRNSHATPDVFMRAEEAVDAVVRAHADPEAARARMRAMSEPANPW